MHLKEQNSFLRKHTPYEELLHLGKKKYEVVKVILFVKMAEK